MPIAFTCPLCKEQNSVGPEFAGRRGTCAFCGATVIVPQTSGLARLEPQSTEDTPRKSSTPWILILAVICVALLFFGGILASLLLPAIQAAREAARRAACMNKLRQIDLALQKYMSSNGRFPPAATTDKNGRPLMSWRVAILPYMEQNSLYRQYDPKQPWNSPENLGFVKQMPPEFRCPSDSSTEDGETSYVMITGQNTVGGMPGSPGTSPSEMIGGISQTILVIEVHGLKIPWTEPRDITLDELAVRLRSGGQIAHVASFNIALADGSVQNLSAQIDSETLRRLATINDGKPVQIDQF